MCDCGIDTLGGNPAGSGGGAAGAQDQAFTIRGQPDPPVGTSDTAIAVLSGATTQIGAVSLPITRVDSAADGTTIKFTQPGVYHGQWWCFLPAGGTAGLMIGASIDCDAALLVAAQNPDLFFSSVFGSDVYFAWPAGSVASIMADGMFVITPAMAADPNLGILRCHQTDSAGGAITAFSTVIADNTLRVRRIGDAQ